MRGYLGNQTKRRPNKSGNKNKGGKTGNEEEDKEDGNEIAQFRLGGMKQKEQQQVIRKFREDVYNVLVCT